MQLNDIITLATEVCQLFVAIVYHTLKGIFYLIIPIREKSVAGEIVAISGTSHGVGKEIAKQYAALGATVVCLDRNIEGNRQTISELKEKGYTQVYGYRCDVSNQEEVFAVAKKVQSEVGDPTILINNAAIMPVAKFTEHTPETIKTLININVLGPMWMIQAYLPAMIEKNKGHIVSISSILGMIGMRNIVPYCATKFAIRGLMEALQNEVGKCLASPHSKVKFTTVFPYMIDSGFCEKPRIKFPSIMPLLTPTYVAKEVIKAQRRNIIQITLPKAWDYINAWGRLLPSITLCMITDFFDTGLDVA